MHILDTLVVFAMAIPFSDRNILLEEFIERVSFVSFAASLLCTWSESTTTNDMNSVSKL